MKKIYLYRVIAIFIGTQGHLLFPYTYTIHNKSKDILNLRFLFNNCISLVTFPQYCTLKPGASITTPDKPCYLNSMKYYTSNVSSPTHTTTIKEVKISSAKRKVNIEWEFGDDAILREIEH